MKNSPFKLTFYFGLITFSIPVLLVLLITIFTFSYRRKDSSITEPKEIVKTKVERQIIYDTVIVEKPKQKSNPTPKVIPEPKKVDTNTINDSL